MMLLFDVIIALYGIYTIYSAIQMKRTQQLSVWFTGNQPHTVRDPRGFINYIYGKTIVMGAMAVLFGIAGFVNDYLFEIKAVMSGILLLFLTVCVWFFSAMSRAKRNFW